MEISHIDTPYLSLSDWVNPCFKFKSDYPTSMWNDAIVCEKWIDSSLLYPTRLAEYMAGRYCAISALKQIDLKISTINKLRSGAPEWPPGVVGSITHRNRYVAAAISGLDKIIGIGIDVEVSDMDRPIYGGVILSAEEKLIADKLCSIYDDIDVYTLMFSAKESLFKAVSSTLRDRITLLDCRVIPRVNGDIVGYLSKGNSIFKFEEKIIGRWGVDWNPSGVNFVRTAFVVSS